MGALTRESRLRRTLDWLVRRVGSITINVTTFGSYDHHEWSCLRKVRYGSEATAISAVTAQVKKRRLGHYRCGYCGGYHVFSLRDPGLTLGRGRT